ncbi:MAG: type II secretion system minor pseudopilin GspI [Pseudomonadota bacterium]
MKIRRSRGLPRGFTLIEVLIALAIVAMAVGALLGTLTSAASNISYLHDKTLAEWVALNRLTEIRIAQQMPDRGKRSGSAVMGGMRWQWEQEVVELPVKGMFRVDVRTRPTGEAVDDSRDVQKQTAQKEPDSSPSGGELDKLSWSTTVTGVVSAARSDRLQPIATPYRGNITGAPNNRGPGAPGNTPNPPGTPGKPGSPANPDNPPQTDQ